MAGASTTQFMNQKLLEETPIFSKVFSTIFSKVFSTIFSTTFSNRWLQRLSWLLWCQFCIPAKFGSVISKLPSSLRQEWTSPQATHWLTLWSPTHTLWWPLLTGVHLTCSPFSSGIQIMSANGSRWPSLIFQDVDTNRPRGTRREQTGGVGPLKNNPGTKPLFPGTEPPLQVLILSRKKSTY